MIVIVLRRWVHEYDIGHLLPILNFYKVFISLNDPFEYLLFIMAFCSANTHPFTLLTFFSLSWLDLRYSFYHNLELF